jgi:DNA mismatch repair protein MutL
MLVPALDFEPISPWVESISRPAAASVENKGSFLPSAPSAPVQHWEKLFDGGDKDKRILEFEKPPQQELILQTVQAEKPKPFNLHGRYLLYQVKSGLMLIDMTRAWARIVYEDLLEKAGTNQPQSQQLLFPVQLEFSEADYRLLEEMAAEIRAQGIVWEPFGKRSLVLTALPPGLAGTDPSRLFQDFLEQYRWNTGKLRIPRSQAILRALAKKSSLNQSFQQWNESELLELVNRLFACKVNHLSPDGQPISRIIELPELASLLR